MKAQVRALACAIALALLLTRLPARAEELYARVIVARAPLRSGPGADFRILQLAERDDSFRVRARAPVGHWLELSLSDGTRAYVQGDAVWLFDPSEGEIPPHARSRIFAPPPLMTARGELAVLLGSLGGSGLIAVRPAYMFGPSFGLELGLAASVSSAGRLFLASAGGLVNLFPSWPVTPFFGVGGGGVYAAPNNDAFIFEGGGRSLLYGGGGLRFGFKRRIFVRIEGRSWALFDADHLTSQQEISGGLSAFF